MAVERKYLSQVTAWIQEIRRAALLAQKSIGDMANLSAKIRMAQAIPDMDFGVFFIDENGDPRTDLNGLTLAQVLKVIEGFEAALPTLMAYMPDYLKAQE